MRLAPGSARVSPRADRIVGWRPVEFVAAECDAAVHPDHVAETGQHLRSGLRERIRRSIVRQHSRQMAGRLEDTEAGIDDLDQPGRLQAMDGRAWTVNSHARTVSTRCRVLSRLASQSSCLHSAAL